MTIKNLNLITLLGLLGCTNALPAGKKQKKSSANDDMAFLNEYIQQNKQQKKTAPQTSVVPKKSEHQEYFALKNLNNYGITINKETEYKNFLINNLELFNKLTDLLILTHEMWEALLRIEALKKSDIEKDGFGFAKSNTSKSLFQVICRPDSTSNPYVIAMMQTSFYNGNHLTEEEITLLKELQKASVDDQEKRVINGIILANDYTCAQELFDTKEEQRLTMLGKIIKNGYGNQAIKYFVDTFKNLTAQPIEIRFLNLTKLLQEYYDLNTKLCKDCENLKINTSYARPKQFFVIPRYATTPLQMYHTPPTNALTAPITTTTTTTTVIPEITTHQEQKNIVVPSSAQKSNLLQETAIACKLPFNKRAQRVTLWCTDPETAYTTYRKYYTERFPLYAQNKYFKQRLIYSHAFSRKLDFIVHELAPAKLVQPFQKQGEYKKPFWSITVPAVITFSDGYVSKVYISYGINQDGTLFHRSYSLENKFDSDIKQEIDTRLQEFIPAEELYEQTQNLTVIHTTDWDDTNDTISANKYVVTIKDTRNNMKIEIPRIYSEKEIKSTEFYKNLSKKK